MYEVAGNGPRVLLIHGTGVGGRAWAPQVAGLHDRFTLAWFDNPGLAGGPVGDVAAMAAHARSVLDALGWERAHVVGHSLGGVIAQQLAIDAGTRVQSLSLLCTFLSGRSALSFRPADLWLNLRCQLGPAAWRRRAFFELVGDPSRWGDEAAMVELEQAFGRPLHAQPPAALAQVRALVAWDGAGRVPVAGVPARVLAARDDRLSRLDEGRRLAAAWGAPLTEVDGGHAVVVSAADRVNDWLAEGWRGAQP